MIPVQAVDGIIPMVKIHGKFKKAPYSRRLGMVHAPEFADGYVKFEDKNFTSYYGDVNNELRLNAILRSDRDFKNCYLVLAFDRRSDAGKAMLAVEVPDLDANQKVQLRCRLAINEQMTHMPYQLHLFSGEREIMTSENRGGYSVNDTKALAMFRATRPVVVYRLAPKRPADLANDATGSCLLRFTIDTSGQTSNITVVSATQPEFGRSAADALEQWVFRPAIVDHHFAPITIQVPFTFDPRPTGGK